MEYLRSSRTFFLPLFIGVGFISIYNFALLSWLPTLLVRGYGLDAARAGYYIGAIGVPAGVIGTFTWSWRASRLERRGTKHSVIRTFLTASLIAVPFLVIVPILPWLGLLLLGVGVAIFCGCTSGVLSFLAIQSYGSPEMRARLVAVFVLCANLPGFVVGPLLVPFLASFWKGDPRALGHGMSILGLLTGPLASLCFYSCLRSGFIRAGAHDNPSRE
jgi:hypothetical protein